MSRTLRPRCGRLLSNGLTCGFPFDHVGKYKCGSNEAIAAKALNQKHSGRTSTESVRKWQRSRYRFLDSVKLTCGCVDCGYSRCAAALEFDHPPGSEKLGDVGTLVRSASWERLMAEMEKCEVVCSNCHRERTVSRREAQRGRARGRR